MRTLSRPKIIIVKYSRIWNTRSDAAAPATIVAVPVAKVEQNPTGPNHPGQNPGQNRRTESPGQNSRFLLGQNPLRQNSPDRVRSPKCSIVKPESHN